ncbi:ThiF family adenylyltransferase [Rhizobium sp. SU303]|uniref:ThiF family adenylyltransferase n=1 Tax=Rhizobium sp. SU303 TaxID=3138065 RepID=UPI001E2A8D9D|nr:ThiF family adenylyltransferase [Rhizobium leguminosarum]UFW79904.1 ThiF family adenylyltransferase [Rhizobium leguminosarum bv. viciae]
MIWWWADQGRARAEKAAFVALQEEHDWLTSVRIRHLANFQLCVDVEIVHGGEKFPLVVIYPTTFPDTPPIVLPHGELRLSDHQYGPGGELCLQWRPDNWDPSVTGAMMVESAHGLIAGERPSDGEAAAVPSEHRSSLAGELRFETWRLMVPEGAWASLDGQLPEAVLEISLTITARRTQRVAHLRSIGAQGNEVWISPQPAPNAPGRRTGFILRTAQDMSVLALHVGGEFNDLAKRVPELASLLERPEWPFIIVLEKSGRKTVFDIVRSKAGHPFLVPYRIVEEEELARRSASNRESVSRNRVAIVGCGSIGSKVAASLARAGVRKFLLVDEDIFLTGNLVRNELDAWAIGWHKVDALADRIGQIVTDTEIDTRRVALGSQTSALGMESTLESIGECDLIVDVTANPTSFNLCAGAARRHRKPMIWASVFGGGIGGIIARARPDIDPPPLATRNQIATWCDDHETPWQSETRNAYEMNRGEEPPFIADDADVSVIAAHATRLALDILQGGETTFPHSAYAIGLKRAWIFEAAFDTWPVDLQPTGTWEEPASEHDDQDIATLMSELLDENPS